MKLCKAGPHSTCICCGNCHFDGCPEQKPTGSRSLPRPIMQPTDLEWSLFLVVGTASNNERQAKWVSAWDIEKVFRVGLETHKDVRVYRPPTIYKITHEGWTRLNEELAQYINDQNNIRRALEATS